MDPAALSPLRVARLHFSLTLLADADLPTYKGSLLRGGFGNALRRLCCVQPIRKCQARCELGSPCLYGLMFESPAPADPEGRYAGQDRVPHPYWITPPLDLRRKMSAGEGIAFDLSLVGRAVDLSPYVIAAYVTLGQNGGLGRGRAAFRVAEVRDGLTEAVVFDGTQIVGRPTVFRAGAGMAGWEGAETLCLDFLTPVTFRSKGQRVSAGRIDFPLLVRWLLRRASDLARCHCGAELDLEYEKLIEEASRVDTVCRRLKPYAWERNARSNGQRMSLEGHVGQIVFRGDIQPFLSLLALGERLHVGSYTAFGHGKYRMSAVQEAASGRADDALREPG